MIVRKIIFQKRPYINHITIDQNFDLFKYVIKYFNSFYSIKLENNLNFERNKNIWNQKIYSINELQNILGYSLTHSLNNSNQNKTHIHNNNNLNNNIHDNNNIHNNNAYKDKDNFNNNKIINNNNNNHNSNNFNNRNNGEVVLNKKDLLYGIKIFTNINQKNNFVNINLKMTNLFKFQIFNQFFIPKEKLNISFNDIGGIKFIKQKIEEFLILPIKRPLLFQRGNLKKISNHFLFYGPPGNGKTMLIKAIAKESNFNLLKINTLLMNLKLNNNINKLIHIIFSIVLKFGKTIIFIDEIDSLFNNSNDDLNTNDPQNGIINNSNSNGDGNSNIDNNSKLRTIFLELLNKIQMDNNFNNIILIAETNKPYELDKQILQKFNNKIFIDLPNLQQRKKILKLFLKNEAIDSQLDYLQLAKITKYYSVSDIIQLIKSTCYIPIRERLFQNNGNNFDYNSFKKILNYSDLNLTPRKLTLNDFQNEKEKIKPSLFYNSLAYKQVENWRESYNDKEKEIFL
ncbi:hypothetical protein M0813_05842 [Anaeramoeba flamelloides]|uniref:AAA+ ATPase domain-containing protein n=1 Tax=Anaeramoeba flamelloides TaxID=1746091 RepID=A0ABQ8XFI9_9EUKA|nr:hypothetical protein M0813_05842 [Anaeramoeba flamelloides]